MSGGGPRAAGLRALTLNVLAPRYADWPRRERVLRDGLRELAPDVVALQEVAWGADAEAGRAPRLLGEGWHAAWHPRRDADGVGAVLASRWPLTSVRELDLHVTPRTAAFAWCAVVLARVAAPEPLGPLLVAHHKPSWPYDQELERERQAVAAARFVEAAVHEECAAGRPEPHVVLLGDFDAPPDAASVRFWTGRQSLEGFSVCYRDAWPAARRPGGHRGEDEAGHTFTPRNPLVRAGDMPADLGRRIDYVMVRSGHCGPTLEVAGCARVLDAPVDGVQASDHYGVLADLVLPARPPGARD